MDRRALSLFALATLCLVVAIWGPGSSFDPADSPSDPTLSSSSQTDDEQGRSEGAEPAAPSEAPPHARWSAKETLPTSVQSSNGAALSGTLSWLTLTPALQEALTHDLLVSPSRLYELGHREQHAWQASHLDLELPADQPRFFWIESPGHRPYAWFSDGPPPPAQLTLAACPPFEVELLDAEAGPIQEARVVITRSGVDLEYPSLTWRQRLERRYFQASSAPSEAGIATFDVLPSAPAFLWVKPQPPYGVVTRDEVSLTGRTTITLQDSAAIYGTVTDREGKALEGVLVAAMRMDEHGTRSSAGDQRTDAAGRYRLDQVAANGEGLQVIAYQDGYESQVQALAFPRAGHETRIEFELQPAKPRTLRVTNADGLPLAGLLLEFAHTPFDWIPLPATVGADGLTPVRGILADDTDYFVNVYSAGTRVLQTTIHTESSDQAQSLVITGLGRFEGTFPSQSNAPYLEITPQAPGTRTFSVDHPGPCPWLPIGPAHVQLLSKAGEGLPIVPVMIREGMQAWPELPTEFTTLRFSLDLLPGESVEMEVVGAGYVTQVLGAVQAGANQVILPAPGLEFRLVSDQRGAWSLGTYSGDGRDIDLGELVWPGRARLTILVEGPDGVGMPRVAVDLFSVTGAYLLGDETDSVGMWAADDLSPGAYQVRLSPQAGHGAALPAQEHRVVLASGGAARLHARFETPGEFRVHAPAGDSRSWAVETESSRGVTRHQTGARGTASFGYHPDASQWRAWRTEPGHLMASGEWRSDLQGDVQIEVPTALTVQTDASSDGVVQLLHRGRVLAWTTVGADGQFLLSCQLPQGYSLRWADQQRRGPRVRVEEVLRTRQLTTRTSRESGWIQFVDQTGSTLSGTMLQLIEPGEVAWANRDGRASLQADWLGAEFLATREGFHPATGTAQPGAQVELRALGGPLRVQLGEEDVACRITPRFPLSVPLDETVAHGPPGSEVTFTQLPEGSYLIEWAQDDGIVHREQLVQVQAGQAHQARPAD